MKIARLNLEELSEIMYLLEIMKDIARDLDSEEKRIRTTYKVTGQEQARKWNNETRSSEPLWEDDEETIPKMTDKWEDVAKAEDEYSDEDRMKLKVLFELRKALASAC